MSQTHPNVPVKKVECHVHCTNSITQRWWLISIQSLYIPYQITMGWKYYYSCRAFLLFLFRPRPRALHHENSTSAGSGHFQFQFENSFFFLFCVAISLVSKIYSPQFFRYQFELKLNRTKSHVPKIIIYLCVARALSCFHLIQMSKFEENLFNLKCDKCLVNAKCVCESCQPTVDMPSNT